MSGDT